MYEQVPQDRRLEVARAAAHAAEAIPNWGAAARWHAEVAGLAQGAERSRALQRVLDLADTRLTSAELASLKASLPPAAPSLPPVTLRLARAQLQQQDTASSERTARELIERWPGSPVAKEARVLLERLAHVVPVNPRTIGLALPLSGKQKAWGEAILRGVNLALGERGFRVVAKDTRGDPESAAKALEELAYGEGVVAALGGVVNAEAPRAAAVAQAQGVPFISLARASGITQAGPFVFRNMLTSEAQAKALAEFSMARRSMKRFALLWPQIPYGQELADDFWDEVEARGGEVRAAERYESGRTTFSPLVKSMVGKLWLEERRDYEASLRDNLKDSGDARQRRKAFERSRSQLAPVTDFDAIFIPDFAKNVALVTPALAVEDIVTQTCDPSEVARIRRATGRHDLRAVQLLGANGWDDPSLIEKAGKYVECAIFVDGFFPASERPATRAFVSAYQARYGHMPSILEASAYDAAGMLRRAIEGGATTRAQVREKLAGERGYPGATGDLSFDARREVSKPLFFITVDHGVLRELTPAELAAPGPG